MDKKNDKFLRKIGISPGGEEFRTHKRGISYVDVSKFLRSIDLADDSPVNKKSRHIIYHENPAGAKESYIDHKGVGRTTLNYDENQDLKLSDDEYDSSDKTFKKKVLCLIDVYGWAAHNRVRAFRRHLSDRYDFDCMVLGKDLKSPEKEITHDMLNKYDIVYMCNWGFHNLFALDFPSKKRRKYKLVTTVCSHQPEKRYPEMLKVFSHYDVITTSNIMLQESVTSMLPKSSRSKVVYTPFGVDTEVYYPRLDINGKNRKFCFVGKTSRKMKGYGKIQSAIILLQRELHVCNHKTNYGPDQMADMYSRVGTNICYSESEGTPNPALESSAMGRAVIAPPVGNIVKLFGKDYPLEPITSDRMLVTQIENISRDAVLHRDCCVYLLEQVNNFWDWKHRVESFDEIFRS